MRRGWVVETQQKPRTDVVDVRSGVSEQPGGWREQVPAWEWGESERGLDRCGWRHPSGDVEMTEESRLEQESRM